MKSVIFFYYFLAHLSTTCSRGAFRVVMCPSCVVNNFFKHLLPQTARPIWTKLGRILPWEVLLKNCSQNLIPSKTGCHGNEIEFFKQFFKNLLLWNRWSDFEIISQECSFGDPFQKLFAKLWSVHKMLWWMGASCTIGTWRNSWKIFSKTAGQILK